MDIITKLKNKENFVYKFDDVPQGEGGKLNPGWAEPTFDDFLTRMVSEPIFLNQSTIIPMTSLQHDLDMFEQEVDFETQRMNNSPSSKYADLKETPFSPIRKQLLAHPLALRSTINQNYLDENIEKEGFLSTWTSYLAAQAGPALERYGIFANTATKADIQKVPKSSAYRVSDGILTQLFTIHKEAKDKGIGTMGIGNLVFGNEMTDGILRNIHRYVENNGDLSNATLVLPPQIYSRFMADVATERDTDLGDVIWVDGKTPKVMGIEIKNDHVLRYSPNNYNIFTYTKESGEYNPTGDQVIDALYGFLSKPTNNVFGIMRDTEVKQEYSIDVLGYKTVILSKADAACLFEQDTLAIPFTPSGIKKTD